MSNRMHSIGSIIGLLIGRAKVIAGSSVRDRGKWSGRRESNPRMQLGKLGVPEENQSVDCKTASFGVQSPQRVTNEKQNLAEVPSTPIAAELQAYFSNGGSIWNAIKLVETLERACLSQALLIPSRRRADSGKRGSRLSENWSPSPGEIAYAADRGMPPSRVQAEAEKFRNYWVAKSGAGATKRDWTATWRNWIITAMERGGGPTNFRGSGSRSFENPRRFGDWIRCHHCRNGPPRSSN
jgi:hypothetical protein